MTEILMREAIKRGLEEALERDPNVLVMGEDIGEYGGAYAVTDGFLSKLDQKELRILQFLKQHLLVQELELPQLA